MRIHCRVSRMRMWLRLLILAIACAIGTYGLGLGGFVFALLVAGSGMPRSGLDGGPRGETGSESDRLEVIELPDQIHQVWMLQSVICLRGSGINRWLYADQFTGAEWAQLRRYLIRHCPSEPLGLSMSK